MPFSIMEVEVVEECVLAQDDLLTLCVYSLLKERLLSSPIILSERGANQTYVTVGKQLNYCFSF